MKAIFYLIAVGVRPIESKIIFFKKNVKIGVDDSFYMIYVCIVFGNY